MFTGACCEPVYPVTDTYAHGVLQIYYPWTGCFIDDSKLEEFIKIFNNWIKDKSCCPKVVRLGYEQAMRLKFSKEPTSKTGDIEYEAMAVQPDKETQELVELVSIIFAKGDPESGQTTPFDFGQDFNWSRPCIKVSKQGIDLLKYYDICNGCKYP
jgi:hypothetical protein